MLCRWISGAVIWSRHRRPVHFCLVELEHELELDIIDGTEIEKN